jgi:hypothetical protein
MGTTTTTTTTAAAPPTAAANNCSWGGNGEQRGGEWDGFQTVTTIPPSTTQHQYHRFQPLLPWRPVE